MTPEAVPPKTYQDFVQRFPEIGRAWELLAQAGQQGPLDRRTIRLVKLAIAIGALREGAVHASVRKAQALGISRAEIEQIISLAAGTLGMPATVAVFSWIREELEHAPSPQNPGR